MRVTSDFPGGNGTAFECDGPDRLYFAADCKGGPYSMWFHFAVEAPACDVLRCELRHGETALGWPYNAVVRPVFRRTGGRWQRVPPPEIDAAAGVMRFEVPCRKRATEIAFCYPYQPPQWDRIYERVLAPAGARAVELGISEGGRALVAYEWGQGPVEILLASRHHSGETPGTYVLEAAAAALVAAPQAPLTVRAIPLVDVDGVVAGMYGKERPPVDFGRAWGGKAQRVEIEACKRYLAALPRPPAIAVDCHAPTATDPHFIECGSPHDAAPEFARRLARLVEHVAHRCANRRATALSPDLTGPHPDWYPDGLEEAMAGYLQATYGTLAFTLEAAYHAAGNGEIVGPSSWRRLGESLALGILDYLREGDLA